ncbi:MAG: D-2-hydroxyacid dehydrogenase [Saprospiraceae bacterium]
MKVLVNDGIEEIGKSLMEEAGITVDMTTIPQDELLERLNDYDGICVRSATKVRQALIDVSPNIKVIGRGGVGLDNIDVEYAEAKGISVVNTPAASSRSVAELAMSHLLSIARFVHQSNRTMPQSGATDFGKLKKAYSAGVELEGKTMGLIGFGRIGQELAACALGMGMHVIATDPYVKKATVKIGPKHLGFSTEIETTDLDTIITSSDVISVHIPSVKEPIIGKNEIARMKDGVILVNTSRGGVIDEKAILDGLNSGKLKGVGLDVFVGEPTPNEALLSHPKISLTPHIGASTEEAQNKVGIELAQKMIAALKK